LEHLFDELTHLNSFEQISVAIDFNGVDSNEFTDECIAFLSELCFISQNNYPEMLSKILLINLESSMKLLIEKLTCFLSIQTKTKVKIINSKEEIFKYVEKQFLIFELGGELDDDNWQYQYSSIAEGDQEDQDINEDIDLIELSQQIKKKMCIEDNSQQIKRILENYNKDQTPLNTEEVLF
jgi:anti-anti-sigma regulatory factor